MRLSERFRKFANKVSELMGSAWAFITAVTMILIWLLTGPMFGFSQTWQIVINTITTIVTFLMVFVLQNSQNRDAKAFHLKLDELLRAVHGARNSLVDLEELSEEELDDLQRQFREFRELHSPERHKRAGDKSEGPETQPDGGNR